MLLLGKLFRGQLIQLNHFTGQFTGILKALRKKHDLGDHGVVGYHHGYWSEEGLEVVRQLGPARVAGIHRDKHSEVLLYGQYFAFELNFSFLLLQPNPNGEQLLCYD
jgi:hypothetical protein